MKWERQRRGKKKWEVTKVLETWSLSLWGPWNQESNCTSDPSAAACSHCPGIKTCCTGLKSHYAHIRIVENTGAPLLHTHTPIITPSLQVLKGTKTKMAFVLLFSENSVFIALTLIARRLQLLNLYEGEGVWEDSSVCEVLAGQTWLGFYFQHPCRNCTRGYSCYPRTEQADSEDPWG